MKRVLIVDDHPLLREGITHVLKVGGYLEIRCQAGSANEAQAIVEKSQPDLPLPGTADWIQSKISTRRIW